MTFELDGKRNVYNHYGVRTTNQSFGGVQETGVIKTATYEINVARVGTAAGGISSAAWAKNGMDLVIPAGASFVSARLVVETAFDALTALTIGTYKASDGTTALDADGLIAAAGSALTAIDAIGDVLIGAGAQLATGTAGLGALAEAAVIRTLYTGTVPTVGKASLIVEYMSPTA